MKRWLFIIAIVLLVGILRASNAFTATYDATGIWSYSTSNNWVDPGTAGCEAQENETATATITQTQDNVTLVIGDDELEWTGTVSGATYNLSTSWPKDGGTVTANLTFTLSSNTSGSGTITWSWTDGTNSCNGGSVITMIKLKPDLIATKFESLSPQTEGDNYYVEVTCNNWGDGSADASHMQLFLSTDDDLDTSDDYYVGKQSVAQIAPNGSVTVRFDYTMPDLGSGTYNFWPVAIADCDSEIDETDETNNQTISEGPFKGQDRSGGDGGGGGCFISVINGK